MTPPEIALWQQLRQRPLGLKFRRQHPIGPYTADFFCASAKLIIEVDGQAHNLGDNPKRDDRRDARLSELGFTTLRIPALQVMKDANTVADALTRYAAANPLHHPTGGPPPRPGEDS